MFVEEIERALNEECSAEIRSSVHQGERALTLGSVSAHLRLAVHLRPMIYCNYYWL